MCVKFEMARSAAVSVDRGCSVGILGHEFERAAISDQERSAPFYRDHFSCSIYRASSLPEDPGAELVATGRLTVRV